MLYFHIKDLDDKLSLEIVKASIIDHQLVNIETRKLYPEDIKKKFNSSIADFIIKEQLKAMKSKGLMISKNTVEMNKLIFNLKGFLKLLEILQPSDLIFFNRKKININKNKVELIFKCKKANESMVVDPYLNLTSLISLRKCNFNACFAIFNHELFLFKEQIEKDWLKVFKKNEIVLVKRELKYFLKDFENQLIFDKIEKKQLEPMLILTNHAGICAILKFKYQERIFLAYSQESIHHRDLDAEKAFINDLKDAGYVNSNNENLFYCPQPKVFETVKLLIEIGWTVFNYQNKEVILEKSSQIEFEKTDDLIKVNAKINFESNQTISENELLQLCMKEQNFLDLSDKVGLIDTNKYRQKLDCFINEKKASVSFAKITLLNNVDNLLTEKLLKFREILINKKEYPQASLGENFSANLFDYQKIGFNFLTFLYKNRLAAFLADEMGLGKTVQVLAFFSCLRNFCPVLIIAPKSLVNNWKLEFNRFLPNACVIEYYGPKRSIKFNLNTFILTTYGTLNKDWEKLSQQMFECVVLDESSYIKNDKTKTFKAVSSLSAHFKICLNGTPIENNVGELISQFNYLIPNLINIKMPVHQIRNLITPFILKRTKKLVELDLPEKIEQIVYVTLKKDQQVIYDQVLLEARSVFSSKEKLKAQKMHVFKVLLRLRQICCDPALIENSAPSAKLDQFLLDIKSVAKDHKILVFSQFTSMLKKIRFMLNPYKVLYFDGQTPLKERMQLVEAFQKNEEPCIFLMSLKAAAFGLNLQSADYVLIYDPWWNDAVEKQAIDRAHRIGRSRSLIAKKYITINTIEEKIYRLKLNKLKTSEMFTPQNLSTDDLYDLLY